MNLLWSDSEDDRANYWLIYETLIGYQISPPLKNILEIMLAKDPTKRPKADEALQHPWFKSGPELSQQSVQYMFQYRHALKDGYPFKLVDEETLQALGVKAGVLTLAERKKEAQESVVDSIEGATTKDQTESPKSIKQTTTPLASTSVKQTPVPIKRLTTKRVTNQGIARVGEIRTTQIHQFEVDLPDSFELDEGDKLPLFTNLALDEIMDLLEPLLSTNMKTDSVTLTKTNYSDRKLSLTLTKLCGSQTEVSIEIIAEQYDVYGEFYNMIQVKEGRGTDLIMTFEYKDKILEAICKDYKNLGLMLFV
ncbi:hypothetical protein FGO68_gene3586 [Halteria grandinella]|uniref:Protein kinase domain-containing protein n=1 Tax=Halteria grandinella TaxID=5974 RepID=A0A8J8T3B0_HALGN|nr:hypothetical protein FGO68_gene3586 [Halteria grandinella]